MDVLKSCARALRKRLRCERDTDTDGVPPPKRRRLADCLFPVSRKRGREDDSPDPKERGRPKKRLRCSSEARRVETLGEFFLFPDDPDYAAVRAKILPTVRRQWLRLYLSELNELADKKLLLPKTPSKPKPKWLPRTIYRPTLTGIPSDVVKAKVIQFLSEPEAWQARLTCHLFNNAYFMQPFTSWKSKGNRIFRLLKKGKSLPKLSTLCVHGNGPRSENLAVLCKAPSLQRLRLNLRAKLFTLPRLHRLRELYIFKVRRRVADLPDLPELQRLEIHGCSVVLRFLERLGSLKMLLLKSCKIRASSPADALVPLAHCKLVHSLQILNCSELRTDGDIVSPRLDVLSELPKLTDLALSCSGEIPGSLRALEKMAMHHCTSGDVFHALKYAPRLKKITVSMRFGEGLDLRPLGSLPALEHLDCFRPAHLPEEFPVLKRLTLVKPRTSSLEPLRYVPELNVLKIMSAPAQLQLSTLPREMPKLQTLHIWSPMMTPLSQLPAFLPSLTHIGIEGADPHRQILQGVTSYAPLARYRKTLSRACLTLNDALVKTLPELDLKILASFGTVADYSPVKCMPELETLRVIGNPGLDFETLPSELTKLKHLQMFRGSRCPADFKTLERFSPARGGSLQEVGFDVKSRSKNVPKWQPFRFLRYLPPNHHTGQNTTHACCKRCAMFGN